MGSLFKRGRTKERTSEHGNNVRETTKDIRMHQKGQAFIKADHRQFQKKLNEKIRKEWTEKGTDVINTFLNLNISPQPPEVPVVNKQAESLPPALL